MPKTFYTERDIIDLAERGVTQLEVNEDVVLTDLARERALQRGLRLVRSAAPGAPEPADAELIHRVKAAVLARLGPTVDSGQLDAVIARIVAEMK